MNDRRALCPKRIVKNKMANLERCLTSAAPRISWVVGDTGPTDDPPEFVRSFFAARNTPGELHSYPFIDLAQARRWYLRLLTGALLVERDPVMIARYMFYFANILRNAGQWKAGLRMYLRGTKLGHWVAAAKLREFRTAQLCAR